MTYTSASDYNSDPGLHKQRLSNLGTWIVKEDYVYDLLEGLGRDAKLLEIGCGNGRFLDNLKKRGFNNIWGADLNNYLTNPEHAHIKVDLNTQKLPLAENEFDAVLAFQTIEHLENYFLIAQEARRVLKPNGLFIFSVPNQFNIFYRIKFALTGEVSGWDEKNNHLLFLTRSVFKKTYLRDFELEDVYFRKGLIPMYGRLTNILNKIPGVDISHKLRILPRREIFADDVCYVLRKNNGK